MKWLALCTPTHTPGQRQEKTYMHTHTNGKQARRRIIELFSFSSQLPLFYWSHRSFLVAQSITSSALWENSASWPLSLHAGGFSVSNDDSLYKTLCWRNRPSACTDRLCSHKHGKTCLQHVYPHFWAESPSFNSRPGIKLCYSSSLPADVNES